MAGFFVSCKNWIAHQWRQATLISAILIVPLAVAMAGVLAPKRASFDGAGEVPGKLASAGMSCLLASTKIAWFADACEGQARAIEPALKRGLLALDMAEQGRAVALGAEIKAQRDALCKQDRDACEVASAPVGEPQ